MATRKRSDAPAGPAAPRGQPVYPSPPSWRRHGLSFRQAAVLAVLGRLDYDLERLVADGEAPARVASFAGRVADAVVREDLQSRRRPG